MSLHRDHRTRNNHRLNRHSPAKRAYEARARRYFEEGRAAAKMGNPMCPYSLPATRREWQAGYRFQIGPASSAGEGETA